MALEKDKVKAIIFDYGNTLIEFGPKQMKAQFEAFEKVLTQMFGHCDMDRMKEIRDRQIVAPFSNNYKENDLNLICEELIKGLYGVEPKDGQVDTLIQTRYETFLESVTLNSDVTPLLERLENQYRLGFLSNYPCSRTILNSLKNLGLLDIFDGVVISGDIGFIKPHPKPFEAILSQMDLLPEDCVYVGDNWLADVQGAKRMGMQSILISQYSQYEKFEPEDGDFQPDARIKHLTELENMLLH